ncbi:GCN5-related N-acetyltransferase [Kribbella flavida DSM 17836]|uniref:GCN5-related N-acetyltransferase n=1 Tax=Kribbella flavida (strain DSM 17836 / JCM 10339 / NBRC 14399) TaxID=479435 RepID=D2PPI2_KRIFD|nr:GNAT family N-acetyltransferase [Kribbella flavida]ADB30944.1 GCN5-related N-acetyltransferase [Kribbella flavida DSM 17836]
MIEVRRAVAGDGDAVGEIHAASWAAAYAPLFDTEFAAAGIRSRLTRWHQRIAERDGTVLLGLANGRRLAMAWVAESQTRPGVAEILSFYGHPDGWGSGVAAALMDGTLQALREHGFTRVHLWTLRDTPQSRRFYTKSGFTETGATRTRDFGDGRPLPQVEYERAC